MMSTDALLASCGPEGNDAEFLTLARELQRQGDDHLAATAYDRAFGLAPHDPEIAAERRQLLDRLAMEIDGIIFRYVPAGSFLMGSEGGDDDERPIHAVQLQHYWVSHTPISWALYCSIRGWLAPPAGCPEPPAQPPAMEESQGGILRLVQRMLGRQAAPRKASSQRPAPAADFGLHQANKIRLQYCEDQTTRARDWHAHVPQQQWTDGRGNISTSRQLFGDVPREQPDAPFNYSSKPMVAVSWQEAEDLCAALSSRHEGLVFHLPTEAQWEKAACGGLVAATYAWGNEPPDANRCDFNRFDAFAIQPVLRFPPNGYGLYAVCGSVWEWTSDWYDAEYYKHSPRTEPTGPVTGSDKVLRGGSWADCAEAVTVSFRSSSRLPDKSGPWGQHMSPNIGFRVCCTKASPGGSQKA